VVYGIDYKNTFCSGITLEGNTNLDWTNPRLSIAFTTSSIRMLVAMLPFDKHFDLVRDSEPTLGGNCMTFQMDAVEVQVSRSRPRFN
jgi:hypothetical protein